MTDAQVERDVRAWIERVVIALGLCPFAAGLAPRSVRVHVARATDERALLETLQAELERLDRVAPAEIETALIAVPDQFELFEPFNDFLALTDALLDELGWRGRYQLASFHPRYRFAGTDEDDLSNLTNRAPYPLLHLLREASVARALEGYEHPERIPERNVARVEALTAAERRALFPYLVHRPP